MQSLAVGTEFYFNSNAEVDTTPWSRFDTEDQALTDYRAKS